jgi:type 2 lantibiotic biosynthesis protein LanM
MPVQEGAQITSVPLHTARYRFVDASREASRGELLDAALQVADHLERIVSVRDEQPRWHRMIPAAGHWARCEASWQLYDGLAGIALFLAYCARISNDERRAVFARKVLDSARELFHEELRCGVNTYAGVFGGIGGWVYTLCHCAVLWDAPELLSEASSSLDYVSASFRDDDVLDLSVGTAGCLAATLVLNRCCPSCKAVDMVERCARQLARKAVSLSTGVAWPNSLVRGKQPFVGASHGTSGIAWALLEAGSLTKSKRFRELGRQAVSYEASVFSAESDNWPDFRFLRYHPDGSLVRSGEATYSATWCWGASGVGSMRLRSLHYLNQGSALADFEAAVRTTLLHGFGRDHCLCHGDLGNIDFLVLASEILGDPHRLHEARRAVSLTLDSIVRDGWLCGTLHWVEDPGMMTGLAGIGYGLLRVGYPELVPSILSVCPPVFQ